MGNPRIRIPASMTLLVNAQVLIYDRAVVPTYLRHYNDRVPQYWFQESSLSFPMRLSFSLFVFSPTIKVEGTIRIPLGPERGGEANGQLAAFPHLSRHQRHRSILTPPWSVSHHRVAAHWLAFALACSFSLILQPSSSIIYRSNNYYTRSNPSRYRFGWWGCNVYVCSSRFTNDDVRGKGDVRGLRAMIV